MKKLFYLVLLLSAATFGQIGQNPQTFNHGIALPNLSQGVVSDSILTVDNSGLVRYVLRSEMGSTTSSQILVQSSADIANQELDSTKEYVLDGFIAFAPGDRIIVPEGGLTISGFGFDISYLFSSADNYTLFESPVGGSGNLVLRNLSITITGTGSKVFDITDATGNHAIEIEYVNFSGCTSLGKNTDYRQATWTTIGVYGCATGLELDGTWNGFKVSNTNVFGFGASGNLFKKGANLSFTNRFFLNINIDFPAGAIVTDVAPANFVSDELFQVNSSIAKVGGGFDLANAEALFPAITANSLQSLWVGNIGLPNTALEKLVDTDVTETFNIDWFYNTYYLSATGNTVFTESNLPANTKNTQEIKIYLNPNGHDITFPANWETNLVGTLRPDELNEVTVKFIKEGTYFIKIDNSLSIFPKPVILEVIPQSALPEIANIKVDIMGSYFTPNMFMNIEGVVVHQKNFISDNKISMIISTTSATGWKKIVLNNGALTEKTQGLYVSEGIAYIPNETDWIDHVEELEYGSGTASLINYNLISGATWNKDLDITKNWNLSFIMKESALGVAGGGNGEKNIILENLSGTDIFYGTFRAQAGGRYTYNSSSISGHATNIYVDNNQTIPLEDAIVQYRCIDEVLYLYINGTLQQTYSDALTENLRLKLRLRTFDLVNIMLEEF